MVKMATMVRMVWPIAVLFSLVMFAVLPFFQSGFIPTHDGEYHLMRFYEFETMLRAGHWFPRWAPGLNSGYGIPLFNFFYPFPNYLGVFFHRLGWSLVDSLKLTLATGYITATVFCYLWLNALFGKRAALIGSIVFAFTPYWFVDLYVRGSVGEVMALAWLMVALASIERRWKVLLSFSVAGIIVSHNILAMLFIPLLVGYGMVRKRLAFCSIVSGIALSAYFWVPALSERRYVIGLNFVNFREHFPELFQLLIPSWGTGFSEAGISNGEMSQQLGIIVLVVAVLAGVFVFREGERRMRGLIRGGLMLFGLLIVFMLPISRPLWEAVTPLQLLQYPWRLLSMALPLAGLFGAYVAMRRKGIVWGTLIVSGVVLFAVPYVRPVVYPARDDAYYLSRREFTDGTSSLGNSFSVKWAPWKSERPKARVDVMEGVGEIGEVRDEDPIDLRFRVAVQTNVTIRVNRAYYPGWTVLVDGSPTGIDYSRDGTIVFTVPVGIHDVRVYFGEAPLRNVANAISLVSLFWIVIAGILEVTHAYRHRYHTS